MNNIDLGNEQDKTSLDIFHCGLRYGKTKLQAEQIKQYLEENKIENLTIRIVDSETKQIIDKAIEYIKENEKEYGSLEENEKIILEILRGE